MLGKILVGGVTAAAIVGAGGVALATTGSTPTNGTPSAAAHSAAHTHGHGHSRRWLRHLEHADVVVHTKKHGNVTLHLIRGTVAAVSPSSLTVVAADRTSETFSITKDTKVRARTTEGGTASRPAASTIDRVAKGDRVFVVGTGTGTAAARRVLDRGTK